MSDITHIFATHDISIESLMQKPPAAGAGEVPIVLLTHEASEAALGAAMSEITGLEEVQADYALLRVEGFGN